MFQRGRALPAGTGDTGVTRRGIKDILEPSRSLPWRFRSSGATIPAISALPMLLTV